MSKTKIGDLSFDVGFNVDWRTADICTKLLEIYLNDHPNERLVIADDTVGDWQIEISMRINTEPYKGVE